MNLIQICASQNDLFALDGDGTVYHYNFNTHSWMRLGRGRHGREEASLTRDGGTGTDTAVAESSEADHRPSRSDDGS